MAADACARRPALLPAARGPCVRAGIPSQGAAECFTVQGFLSVGSGVGRGGSWSCCLEGQSFSAAAVDGNGQSLPKCLILRRSSERGSFSEGLEKSRQPVIASQTLSCLSLTRHFSCLSGANTAKRVTALRWKEDSGSRQRDFLNWGLPGLLLRESSSSSARSRGAGERRRDAAWRGGCASPASLSVLAPRRGRVAAHWLRGQHAELGVPARWLLFCVRELGKLLLPSRQRCHREPCRPAACVPLTDVPGVARHRTRGSRAAALGSALRCSHGPAPIAHRRVGTERGKGVWDGDEAKKAKCLARRGKPRQATAGAWRVLCLSPLCAGGRGDRGAPRSRAAELPSESRKSSRSGAAKADPASAGAGVARSTLPGTPLRSGERVHRCHPSRRAANRQRRGLRKKPPTP